MHSRVGVVGSCRSGGVCDDHEMPVNRPRVPPSQRVETALRARLDAGEWGSGDALPGVAALASEYGVAGNTVLKALRKLEADGLIEIVPSWGTFRK